MLVDAPVVVSEQLDVQTSRNLRRDKSADKETRQDRADRRQFGHMRGFQRVLLDRHGVDATVVRLAHDSNLEGHSDGKTLGLEAVGALLCVLEGEETRCFSNAEVQNVSVVLDAFNRCWKHLRRYQYVSSRLESTETYHAGSEVAFNDGLIDLLRNKT